MHFEDFCDKKAKRIGASSKSYDYWTNAAQGYKANYTSNFKVPTKALEKRLKDMDDGGRCMYAADMGYEFGEKKAISDVLLWRNKNKRSPGS